jgi:hypothetical protein
MRKFALTVAATVTLGGALASSAIAVDPHSSGATGQPGANAGTTCGSGNATSQPNGLTTSSFTGTAAQNYAGTPGTPSANNSQSGGTAVSEYDVACLEQTSNGH